MASLSDERRMPIGLCCEGYFGHDFENAIDVEDDHELTVEAMDAAGEPRHAGIEIDGVFLAAVVGEFQDLADLVDQEAIGLAAQVDADRHRRLADEGREENPVNLDPRMAKLAGGVHRLDGQLMVVLDVDRVLEIVPRTLLAA